MALSVNASPTAVTALAREKAAPLPNPAQQAKAAEPAVKAADFGALVASFAKERGGRTV